MRRMHACVGIVSWSLLAAACSSGATVATSGTPPPAATCGGAPISVTEPNSIAAIGENVDTTCASVASYESKFKNGAPGSRCTDPTDCTPVCCPCPDGAHHAMATYCHLGICQSGADACCMVLGTALRACGN